MNYILLLIGFIMLIKGADVFVDSASSIAKILKVPPLIIGLTIVAFGTSAPEAAVSITAAINNQNDMAMANVIGSSIFNILAVVGVASIINPIKVQRSTILKEFPFALLACVVLLVLSHDREFQGYDINLLTKGDGVILLSLFAIFMYYLIEMALTSKEEMDVDVKDENASMGKSVLFSVVGILAIVFGGQIVVNSATGIALSLGLSENLIGLTIVAVGTSLPEFVTSIIAARKGESDIAIGNVVGSNIFNILLVLGASSLISDIAIQSIVFADMLIMIFVTIIAYIFSTTHRTISKVEGFILTILYIIYMAYIIMRQ